MSNDVLLWANVPEEQRWTEEELRATRAAEIPGWLDRALALMRGEGGCRAAVLGGLKYVPCPFHTDTGADLCGEHSRPNLARDAFRDSVHEAMKAAVRTVTDGLQQAMARASEPRPPRPDRLRGILWADVPAQQRMTEAHIRACRGAVDPVWLNRQLAFLRGGGRCLAASRWGREKYVPCRMNPVVGYTLCWIHGGPTVTEAPLRHRLSGQPDPPPPREWRPVAPKIQYREPDEPLADFVERVEAEEEEEPPRTIRPYFHQVTEEERRDWRYVQTEPARESSYQIVAYGDDDQIWPRRCGEALARDAWRAYQSPLSRRVRRRRCAADYGMVLGAVTAALVHVPK